MIAQLNQLTFSSSVVEQTFVERLTQVRFLGEGLIARWCNGSITDFESVGRGSNPRRAA